jgi:hypothetical protein
MSSRCRVLGALWPAILGVLAAHQLAYAGHDDGHLHGYLARIGPALVVAAVLGWIWSWARSRVDVHTVLALQAGLFTLMEIAERLPDEAVPALSDLAPVAIGLVLLPLIAIASIVTDRMVDVLPPRNRRIIRNDHAVLPLVTISGHGCAGSTAHWSSRAPPTSV